MRARVLETRNTGEIVSIKDRLGHFYCTPSITPFLKMDFQATILSSSSSSLLFIRSFVFTDVNKTYEATCVLMIRISKNVILGSENDEPKTKQLFLMVVLFFTAHHYSNDYMFVVVVDHPTTSKPSRRSL